MGFFIILRQRLTGRHPRYLFVNVHKQVWVGHYADNYLLLPVLRIKTSIVPTRIYL